MPEAFAERLAKAGVASVCQSPVGMKQNCSDPDRRIVDSSADSTSSRATPAAPGFSDKASRIPAKYAPRAPSYHQLVQTG
ncbi:hypothetical protein GGE50_000792 [Rhizobium leguminosarum]|nr:hypothetical protein RLV_5322 [Rhizobium leguminosarum bv. viciae]MBB4326231.1 hypothetical protein [Rhizobium leguminosarum]MBB4339409.1 hypothetical protein [Rhizobium leguminosarum]MBB4352478.1 hypothetical protein [Rhizobium leguminosarum]MBB4384695.1 hypothetical protein [Rhizobium leguminosarum]